MWERPIRHASYVMGIDPTGGLTGWDRRLRSDNDQKVDNGVIEVLRIGSETTPDVQVCEYAAPIDSEDLAEVANTIGRVFGGNNEDGQCLCIIEVYPGPGLLTQRRLINEFGYTNLFVWKFLDAMVSRPTNTFGWTSSPKSIQALWTRCKRRISLGLLEINSPALVEEMGDCVMDSIRHRGHAIYGAKDDRVSATFMAMWAAHDWNNQIETTPTKGSDRIGPVNWQASDLTLDQMNDAWEERWEELCGVE